MLIRIYPENPNEKAIAQVVDILRRDGVIVYPTDSVYAFGCSLHSTRAIERIRTLTGKQGDDFSIICHDLSGIFRVPLPSCSVRRTKSPTNSSTAKKRSASGSLRTASRWPSSRHWAIRW